MFQKCIRLKRWIFMIALFTWVLAGCSEMEIVPKSTRSPLPSSAEHTPEPTSSEGTDLRGIWVASVLNLDYPKAPSTGPQQLKAEAVDLLDRCAAMGFNAVFLQVRPSGDALYASDLFPWSAYLTGTQGVAPADGFDPLQFWVEEAHKRGMELHAWINPFRVQRASHDLISLASENLARQNPSWVVLHKDGHAYYNPGIPAVRALIVDGVREIVQNYAVDGVHYDDYFYPDSDFEDQETYRAFGSSFMDIASWRRDNINQLIRETHAAIGYINPSVRFGVSPFGIWANKVMNPLGSDTSGNQSYYNHYADSLAWVKNGWLDYICPQLYWNIGFRVADYKILLEWWCNAVENTGVDLYIGHAAYRSGSEDPTSPWYGTAELKKQLNLNQTHPEVGGSVHFRYSFFDSYPPLGRFITSYYSDAELPEDYPEMQAPNPVDSLLIGRPSADIKTSYSRYYMLGYCDPSRPLLLNGAPVEGVTEDGYFGMQVDLVSGENRFEFVQGDLSVIRTITRTSGGSTPASARKLETAEILAGSTYPDQADVYLQPGEKLTFRCTAPIGADVRVLLDGESYRLYPSTTQSPGSDAIYYTGYSYTYKVPESSETNQIRTIGSPVYRMSYQGQVSQIKTAGVIRMLTPGAPYYARVLSETVFIYPSSDSGSAPIGELPAGAVDYITAVTRHGTWVRLRIGGWVERSGVDCFEGDPGLSAELGSASYVRGDRWDTLSFPATHPTATLVSLTGSVLTLRISAPGSFPSGTLPSLKLPAYALFDAYSSDIEDAIGIYRLTLAPDAQLDGYYVTSGEDGIVLHLKPRPKISASPAEPMKGFVILLDPGHGGTDSGALGPLANSGYAEKDITGYTAQKLRYELEKLGATVLLTREGDASVPLTERLIQSRTLKPDLFLSIHNNAVEVHVDAGSIYGISTWYSTPVSSAFSKHLVDFAAKDLGRTHRKSNYANLYVCRATWCPSVLLETGFICNPGEFAWLTDNRAQADLARSVASAIVDYFY